MPTTSVPVLKFNLPASMSPFKFAVPGVIGAIHSMILNGDQCQINCTVWGDESAYADLTAQPIMTASFQLNGVDHAESLRDQCVAFLRTHVFFDGATELEVPPRPQPS
jgi:hypothetical protein